MKPGDVTKEPEERREERREQRRVIISKTVDPFWNLAAEEYFLDTLTENTRILLLYINSAAIIIGKHQNPWLEVNLGELANRNTVLLRRISGGGTVYHDTGNLNFSFIGSKDRLDRRENLEFVADVLAFFGIDARITDTHDLYAGDEKISGNAFCFRRQQVVHHGTLLVDSDLARLEGLLSPPEAGIETHAVRSKPAATVNISHFDSGITIEKLTRRMTEAFLGKDKPVENISQEDFRPNEVSSLTERNRTWEWNFGRTPDFKLMVEGITVSIRKGVIAALEGTRAEKAEPLVGVPFRKRELSSLLQTREAGDAGRVISVLYSLSV